LKPDLPDRLVKAGSSNAQRQLLTLHLSLDRRDRTLDLVDDPLHLRVYPPEIDQRRRAEPRHRTGRRSVCQHQGAFIQRRSIVGKSGHGDGHEDQ
jgi:hypothetical protein